MSVERRRLARAIHDQGQAKVDAKREVYRAQVTSANPLTLDIIGSARSLDEDDLDFTQWVLTYDNTYGIAVGDTLLLQRDDNDWLVVDVLSDTAVPALTQVPSLPGKGTVPAGGVMPYAGATAPVGWLLCNGAPVSRATYAALFAAIGTAFNTGGETASQFRLPDPKGRAIVGVGAGSGLTGRSLAQTGGTEASNMPSHNHGGATGTGTTGGGTTGTGATGDDTPDHSHNYGVYGGNFTDGAGAASLFTSFALKETRATAGANQRHQHPIPGLTVPGLSIPGLSIASAGGGADNMMPWLALSLIIKT